MDTASDTFDYTHLSDNLASKYREVEAEFLRLQSATDIHKGRLLLDAKEELGHGSFTPWVTDRLGLNPRVAQRLMNRARFVGGKSDFSSGFERMPGTVIDELMDDEVPQRVLAEVVSGYLAEPATRFKADQVKLMVAAAKGEDQRADEMADEWLVDATAAKVTGHMRQRAAVHLLAGFSSEDRDAAIAQAIEIVAGEAAEDQENVTEHEDELEAA